MFLLLKNSSNYFTIYRKKSKISTQLSSITLKNYLNKYNIFNSNKISEIVIKHL